jgi:uncharacterized protein (DUF1778 family)
MSGKPKDPAKVKSRTLRVRMTPEQYQFAEDAAQVKGLGLSTWVRLEILALARKLLSNKSREEGSKARTG